MKTTRTFSIAVIIALLCGAFIHPAQAQDPIKEPERADDDYLDGRIYFVNLLAQSRLNKRLGLSLTPSRNATSSGSAFSITPAAAAPNLPVIGSGTVGRLTKWTGFTSSNSVVGNSTIFENKDGLVGIGTDSPTSRLSVVGTIEATGGFKFPAGAHDATLKGDGTLSSPLGVAIPLNLTGASSFDILSVTNTFSGTGGVGVSGNSNNGTGITGTSVMGTGVFGQSTSGSGVFARSTNNSGVFARSTNSFGVVGESTNSIGVFGESTNGSGVLALTSSTDALDEAIFARGSSMPTGAIAGRFIGKVSIENDGSQFGDLIVAGKLQVTSGMKMFHIDHPLDPENKYLNHAAIESSEVLNIYSGNIRLDENGEAVVRLPEWFQALNADFRYSLTPVGAPAASLYIAEEVNDNYFKIAGGTPKMKVSWQVTGVRSDPTARKFKFDIEEEKSKDERGYYLNPDAFGQSEEKSIQRARAPEGMKLLRQRHIEVEQLRGKQKNQ